MPLTRAADCGNREVRRGEGMTGLMGTAYTERETAAALRTLPGDDVRQIMWRFADRYDLQMVVQSARSVARGRPGAISVASIAPRGSMWSPQPAVYMDKIVVDRAVGSFLVPECMDAPVGWTLALVARATGTEVRVL